MGSIVGEVTGANRSAARAAHGSAMAQQRAAGQLNKEIKGRVDSSLEMSPEELASQGQALDTQSRNLEKQEKLVGALDPAILEASQQALSILRGEESGILAPVRAQRQRQRQQLLDTLRNQLGPGAETSSAGQQALQKFDMETTDVLAGRQQSSLSQLFGLAQGGMGSRQALGQQSSLLNSMGGQNFGQRAGLGMQGAGILAGTGQNVVNSAGARFTGDMIRAQQIQGIGNDVMQLGGAAIGGMAAGGTLGSLGGLLGGTSGGGTATQLGQQYLDL